MIAAAATLVAVRGVLGTHSAPAAPAGFPRYYAELWGNPDARGADLLVGDALTGKIVALVHRPDNATFTGVTGAGDDSTFIVNARTTDHHPSQLWYLLRLAPGGPHPARLSPLPVKESYTDASVVGLALSPNGRTAAIMDIPSAASPALYPSDPRVVQREVRAGPVALRTYAVPSGRLLRTWTRPWSGVQFAPGEDNWAGLSWLADGHTLAYQYPLNVREATGPSAGTFLTLDTTRPGTDLAADTRILVRIPGDNACEQGAAMLSPDGGTLLCAGSGPAADCKTRGVAFSAYSTATGRREHVLYRYVPCFGVNAWVAWTGPGESVIGMLGIAYKKIKTVTAFMAAGKASREIAGKLRGGCGVSGTWIQ